MLDYGGEDDYYDQSNFNNYGDYGDEDYYDPYDTQVQTTNKKGKKIKGQQVLGYEPDIYQDDEEDDKEQ